MGLQGRTGDWQGYGRLRHRVVNMVCSRGQMVARRGCKDVV